ncbi:AAA family ATPase [Vibrio sp. OPT20]|uniref:AAA family ATPase n=1 Tax=Vibrio sp. OPT20 TaxID=2778642 RepID=UPI001880C08E|nr:AAA family ATPase [Vibrio sp. OPT20]MBE8567690.1 ATP-binding protein [Vibrio sp. OPT20]
MKLISAKIEQYRNLKNIHLDFQDSKSSFSSIASPNGGGKSTLQQFIFTTIHCLSDSQRHEYLLNLVSSIDSQEKIELAQYSFINSRNETLDLDIVVYPTNSYGSFHSITESSKYRDKINSIARILNDINSIKKQIGESGIDSFQSPSPSLHRLYRKAKNFVELNSHSSIRLTRNEIISEFVNSESHLEDEYNENQNYLDRLLREVKDIESSLSDENETILCSSNDHTITIRTTASKLDIKELSDSIYLCAPNTQSFLFLNESVRKEVFNSDGETSYYDHIKEAKKHLVNFYTYDISPVNLILESFKSARDLDFSEKLKTSIYGNNFDKITKELNSFLDDKQITVTNNLEKVIFSIPDQKGELSPEDLSHGELKKLSLYVFAKHITSKDSIVLFDEIDIALHPSWQASIIGELTSWAPDRQFIVATHSPQILASTYFKNIIQLCKEGQYTRAKRLSSPPLDRDINVIIGTIMGAPVYPDFIRVIQEQYLEAISEFGNESEEALKIKNELLEHISLDAEFFNDLEFDQEFFS